MQKYIGTKTINAKPMIRSDYNALRGWELPADENGDDEGYLVEYIDGGQSNHSDYNGYISWSPKDVFERAYRSTNNMTFGDALVMLKQGCRVARSGWNGKGMWLILVPGSPSVKPVAGTPYSNAGVTEPTNINPHIDMYTATGEMQPGWLASQTDMLAEDWTLLD
ncbi:DUF2829 domain-containing protein [Neptunomonas sp. XY-337]|uniref:DUF2829 domain-containing protein n=1 Tax=Neptunomonas sp. XY-337 TaxID=2561897 RepID=UPI0010A9BDF5|nr:DUF2829 domain-containing protein [Neptunomonas sp. XY-337]